jgi:hypothetical protein
MVNFFADNRGDPSGPCRDIMRQDGEFVREMIQRTEDTGNEYIANFIHMRGEMGHTDMREGDEESITRDIAAQSMMDSMRVASDMNDRPTSVNVNDYRRHQVHTHPGGFTGLSISDMKSFINRLLGDGDSPDSELVATQTSDGIVLGGVYIKDQLGNDQLAELQSTLSMLNSNKIPMSVTEEKGELLGSFERAGLGFCSVTFPQRE